MSMYQPFIVISLFLLGFFHKLGFYDNFEESATYRAAVVEYGVFDKEIKIDVNVDNYVKLIKRAAKNNVDIIVFPECGLMSNETYDTREDHMPISTFVPNPKEAVDPCTDSSGRYANFLKKLSCNAKRYKIYVLVNLDEMEECDSDKEVCSLDKLNLYNTNVVFDRNGVVIARYRKFNLFDEPMKNRTTVPEISYFDTDFSVRFGSFICFDILFQQPALNLTRNLNISHIIFSTAWGSAMLFEIALQTEQSWAFSENVNLLAANINYPSHGGSGSGIFHADKHLKDFFFITNESITTLLISDVMKKKSETLTKKLYTNYQHFQFDNKGGLVETLLRSNPMPNESFDGYKTWPYYLTNYTSIPLDFQQSKQSFQLCAEEFCCKMNVSFRIRERNSEKNFYHYHFVIYNGLMDNDFDGLYGKSGIFTCGIIACLNSTVDSCGLTFDEYKSIDWPITFEKISISADFKPENTTDYPCSLQPGLRPLEKDFWKYEKSNQSHIEFSLLKPVDELLSFNIFGQNFTRNVPSKI